MQTPRVPLRSVEVSHVNTSTFCYVTLIIVRLLTIILAFDIVLMHKDGEHLGYGGIFNSLAVEFDTWTNVDTQQSDDVFQDHISIHSGGPFSPNSSNRSTSLGFWRPYDVADGKVHTAKVQYLPYVETRYFELMTANENLIPYLKDNGEGRRLGTLAVFVDQGIKEDRPLLAIPVNLSLILNLPDSLAYVGFTASTGRKWQKNEIHRWEWCDSERCQVVDTNQMP